MYLLVARLGTLLWSSLLVMMVAIRPCFADEHKGFHMNLGFAYVDGINDFNDALKKEVESQGGTYDSKAWPIGAMANPYYLLGSGIGVGAIVGPAELLYLSSASGSGSGEISGLIPLGADLRYELVNRSPFVPFVRAGFRDPITFGSNISNGKVGVFFGGGVILTSLPVGMEVSYDTSKVDVDFGSLTSTVKPIGFNVTLFVHI